VTVGGSKKSPLSAPTLTVKLVAETEPAERRAAAAAAREKRMLACFLEFKKRDLDQSKMPRTNRK